MPRTILGIVFAIIALGTSTAAAQESAPTVPEERRVRTLPRQKLSGPRFGFTTFTGETADLRSQVELEPVMTQFGWQFETQLVSLESGNQALMEWVFLLGGMEKEEYNLSLAWLAGYRLENGLEFGVGPTFSYNPDQSETTSSITVAGGATVPFGDIYVPVNLAVGVAEGGPRITALLGWIVG